MHFLFKRHTLTPTEKHSLQSFHFFLQTSPSCYASKKPQHALHHFQILYFRILRLNILHFEPLDFGIVQFPLDTS